MRTLLVSTQTGWGGGENLLAQLAVGLQQRDRGVRIACPVGSAIGAWTSRQASIGSVPLPGRGRGLRAMGRVRLAAADADVVLLNDPHAITYGGVAVAGLPAAKVGVRHTCFPVHSGWKHNRLLDTVVCVAEAAREECLLAGVSRAQTEVIYAGLDPAKPTREAIQNARRELRPEPAETGRVVLAIGSLLSVKGFDTLIEAAALADRRGDGWRLVIAGEGPERTRLEALIAERGVDDRVALLGFRDDVPALLAAADAFASASHREGLSLVLVEAMVAGTPVVATPVGGNGEALRLQGQGVSDVARAVPPGDAAAMADAIAAALEPTEANRVRVETARRWAADRFTVERMASDYAALFERLLRRRSGKTAA
ncbi:MAG: glycosyltransferase [Planctomycetota bacterium]